MFDAKSALEKAIGPLPEHTSDVVLQEDRWQVPTYSKYPLAIVRGEGCYVFDAEGKRYLDLYGGHAVALPGHCHPRVVAAVQAQAARLLFYSNVVSNDVRAAAVKALCEVAPRGLQRVFLCNSGTEANETALKIARKFTGRKRVVSLSDGFHGRTLGSLGATGMPKYRDAAYPIPPGHDYVAYGDLDAFRAVVGPDTAAVLLEPIPSMGGIRVASADFFRGLRALCTERGALLAFDEVQTGFGRTGKMWAGEHFGVTPDLITGAKGVAGGIPAGVVFVREDVAATMKLGEQGTTFGGGPLACAAMAANVRTIVDEKLAENAARVGGAWAEALGRVAGVESVAGLGLMIGVNLNRPAKEVVRTLVGRGFITGTCEALQNQIRLLPPLVLTSLQAQTFTDALAALLGTTSPSPVAAA